VAIKPEEEDKVKRSWIITICLLGTFGILCCGIQQDVGEQDRDRQEQNEEKAQEMAELVQRVRGEVQKTLAMLSEINQMQAELALVQVKTTRGSEEFQKLRKNRLDLAQLHGELSAIKGQGEELLREIEEPPQKQGEQSQKQLVLSPDVREDLLQRIEDMLYDTQGLKRSLSGIGARLDLMAEFESEDEEHRSRTPGYPHR